MCKRFNENMKCCSEDVMMKRKSQLIAAIIMLSICGISLGAVMDEAAIYLPFEGSGDAGASSPCWANRGLNGYGETPGIVGSDPCGILPVCSRGGFKGGAYDGTGLSLRDLENAYVFGLPGTLTLGGEDTEVERVIMNVWSFTITGWFRDSGGNTRILRSPEFELNVSSNDTLEIRLQASDEESPWISSNANFADNDKWRFFAVTYDGTTDTDNLKFYYGSADQGVVLDKTVSVAGGRLVRDGEGSLLTIGNVGAESNRPFDGYMDEIRIFSKGPGSLENPDNSSVLTLEEIEDIRDYDSEWAIVERAAVYLPFEGEISSDPNASCWANRGARGYMETPGLVGDNPEGKLPTVTSDGLLLKGQHFDGSNLDNSQDENAYAFGQYGAQATGTGIDTEVELAIMNVWSFTITGWFRDSPGDQERILNGTLTEINQRGTVTDLQIGISDPNWYRTGADFYSGGHWRFFAITYDGTLSVDNLKTYYATEVGDVTQNGTFSVTPGRLVRDGDGSILTLGNAGLESDRPFTGSMDEIRIWADGPGTDPDNRAALTLEELQKVREYDLTVPTVCSEIHRQGLGLMGDVNHDCVVDLMDFAYLGENWLECNDPADPINCIQNW